MLIRSWLSQSSLGNNLVAKSLEVGADIADFDLEDSVPIDRKEEAREAFVRHLAAPVPLTSAVRVNELSSIEGIEDLLAIVRNELPLDIVILPKVHVSRDIPIVAELMAKSHPDIKLIAMIETVEALYDLRNVRETSPALIGIMFGAADFAADRGMRLQDSNLAFARYEVAMASSRLGVTAIDCPCFDIHNTETLMRELAEARELGFGAKVAIHPSQVPFINDFFSPSAEMIEEARAIVASMTENTSSSIKKRQGQMIGPPFLAQARKVLEIAERLAGK